jgi:hypothetical protein
LRKPADTFREALAAQVEGDVADLLVHAQADLAAHLLQLRPGDAPGLDLVLAHMEQGAELLGHVGARVHGDHRDAGGHRLLDRGPERRGVGDRHDEAGGLLVHGRIDELAHSHHVEGLWRPVVDLDLHVLACRRHAVLDHGPERVVGLSVADHDDAGILLRGSWRDRGEGQGRCGGQSRDE